MMKLIPPPYDVPDWLMERDKRQIHHGPFPLDDILRDSLYYPSSGVDAEPIRRLGGGVFSFIYTDYGISSERLISDMAKPGFLGYSVIGKRDVTQWLGVQTWRNPGKRYAGNWVKKPFAYWFVLQRQEGFEDKHGPRRFSLLYLCAEGVTTYRHLYRERWISPRYLAIIQPGHGFGCNWTDYTQTDSPLHQTVMQGSADTPKCLLYGGCGRAYYYRGEQCWPEYPEPGRFFEGRNYFGVWKRSGN